MKTFVEDKYNEAKNIIEKYGQEHLLKQYDKLNDEKRKIRNESN